MTIDEFIERLRLTPRDWTVDKHHVLRNACGHCPLVAVFAPDTGGDFHLVGDANEDADCIAHNAGMLIGDAGAVIDSADSLRGRPDPLRARLLDACGLKEVA